MSPTCLPTVVAKIMCGNLNLPMFVYLSLLCKGDISRVKLKKLLIATYTIFLFHPDVPVFLALEE